MEEELARLKREEAVSASALTSARERQGQGEQALSKLQVRKLRVRRGSRCDVAAREQAADGGAGEEAGAMLQVWKLRVRGGSGRDVAADVEAAGEEAGAMWWLDRGRPEETKLTGADLPQVLVEAHQALYDRLGREIHELQMARSREQEELAAERVSVQHQRQQCEQLQERVRTLRGDLRAAMGSARVALDEQAQQQSDRLQAEAEEAQEHFQMLILRERDHANMPVHTHPSQQLPQQMGAGSSRAQSDKDASRELEHSSLVGPNGCMLLWEDTRREVRRGQEGELGALEARGSKQSGEWETASSCGDSDGGFALNMSDVSGASVSARGQSCRDLSGLADQMRDASQQRDRVSERAKLRRELHMLHDNVSLLALGRCDGVAPG